MKYMGNPQQPMLVRLCPWLTMWMEWDRMKWTCIKHPHTRDPCADTYGRYECAHRPHANALTANACIHMQYAKPPYMSVYPCTPRRWPHTTTCAGRQSDAVEHPLSGSKAGDRIVHRGCHALEKGLLYAYTLETTHTQCALHAACMCYLKTPIDADAQALACALCLCKNLFRRCCYHLPRDIFLAATLC